MFWLSLISSVLGIGSFLISFLETFKKWRPYTFYFASFMGGLTAGILISMGQSAMKQFSTGQIIYLVALTLILTLVIILAHYYLKKGNDPVIVIIIVLIIVGFVANNFLKNIDQSQSFLKPTDYLHLSKHYENSSDYIRAADYLDRYKELDDNLSLSIIDSIKAKSRELRMKAIK